MIRYCYRIELPPQAVSGGAYSSPFANCSPERVGFCDNHQLPNKCGAERGECDFIKTKDSSLSKSLNELPRNLHISVSLPLALFQLASPAAIWDVTCVAAQFYRYESLLLLFYY